MDISVAVGKFRDVLKRLRPKLGRVSMSGDTVRVTAGGGMLVLLGSFENSASLPVEVHAPGRAVLPLESTFRLLKLLKPKETIRIRTDEASLWIGPTKFRLLKPVD